VDDLRAGEQLLLEDGPEVVDLDLEGGERLPSASVEANAIPIAESASVQRIPPWTVPIGL